MDLLIKLLLTPVVQLLLLTIFAMVAVWRHSRHLKTLMLFQLAIGLVLTCKPAADWLAAPLERAYPAFAQQPVQHIAVLGCYHVNAPQLPLSSIPNPCSTIRLLEAAMIWRQQPQALIHLSGSIKSRREPHTELARRFLLALGVPASQIRLHPNATNTAGEVSLLVQAIPRNEPMALVTSAMHMTRAMRWFASAQRTPIAAPTDFYLRGDPAEPMDLESWRPTSKALDTFQYAFYEYAGLFEQQVQLSRAEPSATDQAGL